MCPHLRLILAQLSFDSFGVRKVFIADGHFTQVCIFSQVFTVLWQQPARKGLQVLTPAGEWIDVPPIPGHLIVKSVNSFGAQMLPHRINSLGDQMSRLTSAHSELY
jgi:hypothetical protein